MEDPLKTWVKISLEVLGWITFAILGVILGVWITAVVWGYIVPRVFPAAIEANLLPAALTMLQTFKLCVLFWALGLAINVASSCRFSIIPSIVSIFGRGWGTVILGVSANIVLYIAIWVAVTVISGFIVQLVWVWVVPDVFAGTVAAGMAPAALSYGNAVLLTILYSVLGFSYRGSSSKSK